MRSQSAPSTKNDNRASIMNLGRLLFSFEGRINRLSYWLAWMVFVPLIFMAIAIATNKEILELYRGVMVLILVWPMLAVQAKRWHDIDMSGWWLWVILLPILGPLIALIMNGFLPGTHGDNHFGPATRQLRWKSVLRSFGLSLPNEADKPPRDEETLQAVYPSYPVPISRPVYPQFG